MAAGIALVGVVWLIARLRPFGVEVRGGSMVPTLLPGDWALAVAARRPSRGHVVVVEHPDRAGLEMVKRVIGVPGDLTPDGNILGPDEFWVEGDNPSRSTDSRQHGPVSRDHLKACVRLIYWPASRCAIVARSPRASRSLPLRA